MGRSRQQYEDRIRSRLGDFGVLQHVTEAQIPLALEDAINQLSIDRPREAVQTFPGDDTAYTFDLTADTTAPAWQPGWSRILELEYPAGERDRRLLDLTEARVDDAGILTLRLTTPATGENLAIRYTTIWTAPADDPADDPIPDIYFNPVCSLAGSRLARWKGTEFARQQSVAVAGTVVPRNASDLFAAADGLARAYTDIVLGRPDDAGNNPPAMITISPETFPDTLFHQRGRMGRGTFH